MCIVCIVSSFSRWFRHSVDKNSLEIFCLVVMLVWLLVSLFGLVAGGAHNSVNTWSGVLQYDEDWGYVDIR